MPRLAPLVALLAACGTTTIAQPGSPAWEITARQRLLAFDTNGSGRLEASEIDTVPCAAFSTLIDEWHAAFGTSFIASYGLSPGLLFRGAPLGIAPEAVAAVDTRVATCVGTPVVSDTSDRTSRALSELGAPATSAEWDREVARVLLAHHDLDQSGAIDNPLEIRDISCDAFMTLDRAIRGATEMTLHTLYGIDMDFIWVGSALGFDEALRVPLGERLDECGLTLD